MANRTIRLFTCPLLTLAALLGACAHQPTQRTAIAATEPHSVTVTKVPAAGQAQSGNAADASSAATPAAVPPVAEVAAAPADNSSDNTTESPPLESAGTAAEQPPAAPVAADLFERIRGGFALDDVDQKAIDRELNWFANHPDYLERVWGRAEMYMYYIVEQLEKRNMPRELALLPVIESAFDPYAYSRARASGLWQFIPGTGSRFGVKQDWWYDGRRDVVRSTQAALDYLQNLHDEFDGDWLLAIASYNCGELNVERAIDRNSRHHLPTDFWHLKLPRETRTYVPRLLAMRRIVAHPGDYGLEFSKIPNQQYFTEINTGGQVDLRVVADVAGILKEEVFDLNPAYHRGITDPTGPYTLLIPIEVADGVEPALLKLTPEQRVPMDHYSVRRGDTVASVAKHFDTSAAMIRELNGLGNSAPLEIGSDVRVPSNTADLPAKALRAAALVDDPWSGRHHRHAARSVVHVVRRGDTLSSLAHRMGTDVHTLANLNGLDESTPLRTGQRLVLSRRTVPTSTKVSDSAGGPERQISYTVRPGDTLSSIARSLQVSVAELLDWNGLRSRNILRPGRKLVAFVTARS
ncbi:MAG TPA: LysM peptidoglycan-binding domain-containing protein [Steroidobacteraceae bacterium]